MGGFRMKKYNDDITQEIGFKNNNPSIFSIVKRLDEIETLGCDMQSDYGLIPEFYYANNSLFSRYNVYIIGKKDKEKISDGLSKVGKFIEGNTFKNFLREYTQSKGREVDPNLISFIKKAILVLLEIFRIMNYHFSMNGLTPKPEIREKEIWEEETNSSLKERKKAVLDVVFGGNSG